MESPKEDFFNRLQFEIGDRWPELNPESITSIKELADFITEKHQVSKWCFLRFLPYYHSANLWLENITGKKVDTNFNLNSLTQQQKSDFLTYTEKEFAEPLTLKRPDTVHTIVFLFPLFGILGTMLISTYLVASKDFSGWVYLSGLAGLIISISLFQGTQSLKNRFHPQTLLEYSKSFYVVNNQTLTDDPDRETLVKFLCSRAQAYFQTPFNEDSSLPSN